MMTHRPNYVLATGFMFILLTTPDTYAQSALGDGGSRRNESVERQFWFGGARSSSRIVMCETLRISWISSIPRRLGRKGPPGDLNYVTMDEVVFFGHERNWPDKNGPACQDSIDEVAREAAEKVAEIHAVFPNAQTGAVEPITTGHGFNPSQLVKDYAAFADHYRAQTGERLAFRALGEGGRGACTASCRPHAGELTLATLTSSPSSQPQCCLQSVAMCG